MNDIINAIKEDSKNRILEENNRTSNLSMADNPVKAGSIIKAGLQNIVADRDTRVVFVDDMPGYNWSHPCRYFLYDDKNAELIQQISDVVPHFYTDPLSSNSEFHIQTTPKVEIPSSVDLSTNVNAPPFAGHTGVRYAVLFSGYSQYWHVNDLEYLYRILIDLYNFLPENIFVYNYDGTYWPGTNIPNYYCTTIKPTSNVWPGNNTPYRLKVNGEGIIDYLAGNPKNNITGIFDILKGKLKENDLLFIHTNNGGHFDTNPTTGNNESSLYMYHPVTEGISSYYASDFAAELKNLPQFAQLIVMMAQCHSGGFSAPVLKNSPAVQTSFTAGCAAGKHTEQGTYFDPFANRWSFQITGREFLTIDNGIVNQNPLHYSQTSMQMAFARATVGHEQHNPVFESNPPNCSNSMFLGFPLNVIK